MRHRHVRLLLFFFLSLAASAQAPLFRHFSQEHGLPSNEVYDMFQDRNGFIWFATDRGLARYDGTEFKRYEPRDGITDITVFDFFPQENGQVWCSTLNDKIFYFEDGSTVFHPYVYNHVIAKLVKDIGVPNLFIRNLAMDKAGSLWFVFSNQYYVCIDRHGNLTVTANEKPIKPQEVRGIKIAQYAYTVYKNKMQPISYFSTQPSEGAEVIANDRIVTANGRQLLLGESEVRVCSKGQKCIVIRMEKHEPLEAGAFGPSGFWVSYRGKGVYIYDFNGHVLQKHLVGHSVTRTIQDCFGSLWFSTIDAGVFLLENGLPVNIMLEGQKIHALTKDGNGNVLASCYNGDVYQVNPRQAKRLRKGVNGYPSYVQYVPAVNSTFIYTNDSISTPAGKAPFARMQKISDDLAEPAFVQYSNYYRYNQEKGITKDSVNFRINDVSSFRGQYYFASMKGLSAKGKGNITWSHASWPKSRIDDLDYEPQKGLFYMGSLGNGVVVFNPQTEKYFCIDKRKGLSDNLVTEVYIENPNVIWACSNHGLNRIEWLPGGRVKVQYITAADGLPGNQVLDVEISQGLIYVGTNNGLCCFDYEGFFKRLEKRHYYLRLKEVAVNGVRAVFNQQLNLGHAQNQLDFLIESVSFRTKELEYRYRLEGLETAWHLTKEKKLSFEYVPPGKYKLVVEVLEDGRYLSNEKIILPIFIAQPFWVSAWFIALSTGLFAGIIYLFFRIRVLTYNRDIIRELLRLMARKIKGKEKYFVFREQGQDIRIATAEVLYVESSGNYIEVVTAEKRYTIRMKIGDFITRVPDPLEFLRIHRSYIIRIDKVRGKTRKSVTIGNQELPVGTSFADTIDKIIF